jgi:hypothetical protein
MVRMNKNQYQREAGLIRAVGAVAHRPQSPAVMMLVSTTGMIETVAARRTLIFS